VIPLTWLPTILHPQPCGCRRCGDWAIRKAARILARAERCRSRTGPGACPVRDGHPLTPRELTVWLRIRLFEEELSRGGEVR